MTVRIALRIESALPNILSLTKFALVGGCTALLFFLVMWICKSVLRFPYVVAVTISYAISTSFHFLANRHFTFRAQSGRHVGQIARYLVMWVANYLVTMGVVVVCVEELHLSAYIGVLASLGITTMTGYLLSRFWVFRLHGVTNAPSRVGRHV